jgi:flagellin-like hook-associated protein FlgL
MHRPKNRESGELSRPPSLCIKEDAIAFILNNVSAAGASRKLGAGIRIANQGKRNAYDGINYLQVAERVLDEVAHLLGRAAELAEQARVDTSGDPNSPERHLEFQQILATIHELFEKTLFNGMAVFAPREMPVARGGISPFDLAIEAIRTTVGVVSIAPQNLRTALDADAAGFAIAKAMEATRSLREALGASRQQLSSVANFLGIQAENFAAAHTQTQDADLTAEVVNLAKFQILNQSGPPGGTHQATRKVLALIH